MISSSASGSVADQLAGSNRSEMIKKNRHYISAIVDMLLTCTRQDIALRGHRETDESLNRGNFLEILSLVSRFDPVVANRLKDVHKMLSICHMIYKIPSLTSWHH